MKVNSDNRQLYIQDFVNGLSREKYIVQPIQDKENWREIGKYNKYKIGNQVQIFPKYLQDQIIADHLEEKYFVGCKIAKQPTGQKVTNRIIIDIDKPEQKEIAFNFMLEVTHKEKPDLLFTSSFRNHLHAYYLFNGYLNESDLNHLRNHLKGIEIYPSNNGIRLPLSRGSYWLDSNLTPLYEYDKNASISEIHTLLSNETTYSDTSEFRAILSDFKRSSRDSISKAKAKLFTSDLPSEFWNKIKELKTVGLTESETRNESHMKLVFACVHKGLSELETVEFCREWHFLHTNGFSQDVKNGNWNQIEKESIAGYKYYSKQFDPLKAKRKKVSLSRADYKRINTAAKKLSLGKKYKRDIKAKKVLTNIYKLCKTYESNEVYIAKTLWHKWNDKNSIIKQSLLEIGLIEIAENPVIVPINDPLGLPTKYRIDFVPYLSQ